jgi:3-hydroxybutyryl-CoA dehydrogenase
MGERELHRIAVIGGGMMGRSLATRVSQAGLSVVARDIDEERIGEVKNLLGKDLDREIDRWGMTQAEKRAILARIEFTTDLASTKGCDLAIETIHEDAAAKKTLLAELDTLLTPAIPIIVNTSTLSITELAQGLAHPERILGMHFLYPVTTSRVVEVVRGQVTSDEAFETGRRFARILGKVPIEEWESPGFVTTRVVMPRRKSARMRKGRMISPRDRQSAGSACRRSKAIRGTLSLRALHTPSAARLSTRNAPGRIPPTNICLMFVRDTTP